MSQTRFSKLRGSFRSMRRTSFIYYPLTLLTYSSHYLARIRLSE